MNYIRDSSQFSGSNSITFTIKFDSLCLLMRHIYVNTFFVKVCYSSSALNLRKLDKGKKKEIPNVGQSRRGFCHKKFAPIWRPRREKKNRPAVSELVYRWVRAGKESCI